MFFNKTNKKLYAFIEFKKIKKTIKKDVNSLGNNSQSYAFIIINYRFEEKIIL